MVTMKITDESGKPELFSLDGPGGDLRVAVGSSQDGRSSVWRLTGSRTAGDIYLGNRDLMAIQKISLHESGSFRLAWTAKSSLDITGRDNRLIDGWRRAEGNEAGWATAFRIWIVSEDVDFIGVPFGKQRSINSILWLPKPPANHAIAIDVVLVRPDLGEVALPLQRPIGGFWLNRNDGKPEGCIVLASQLEVSAKNRAWLDDVREDMNRNLLSDPTVQTTPTVRGIVYGYENDGTRCVWDLSLHPST
jgi:hypothetical protein